MQTIKAIQRLCAVTPSIAVRCADLSVSSVKYGTTPQQKLAAQSEARKKAVTINKYISLARGAVRCKSILFLFSDFFYSKAITNL